jgi:hypothetical protein
VPIAIFVHLTIFYFWNTFPKCPWKIIWIWRRAALTRAFGCYITRGYRIFLSAMQNSIMRVHNSYCQNCIRRGACLKQGFAKVYESKRTSIVFNNVQWYFYFTLPIFEFWLNINFSSTKYIWYGFLLDSENKIEAIWSTI